MLYGQTSPNLTFLLEITDAVSSWAKKEGDLPVCYQSSVQKPASLMVWTIRYTCVFQHDNVKPHTAANTTVWLCRRRVWFLNWPACSPDLIFIFIFMHFSRCFYPKRLTEFSLYIFMSVCVFPGPTTFCVANAVLYH